MEVDLPTASELVAQNAVPKSYSPYEYEYQLEYEAALRCAQDDDRNIEFWNCDIICPESTEITNEGRS